MAIDFTKSYPVIEWDLNNYHFFTKYFGKKEENAKGFKVQIMQDGEVLTPTTETLRIYCKKKDGNGVYIDSSTVVDTYYIINLTNQVYSVVGLVECELQLNSNNKWLYSPTFGINVDNNLMDGSIVSSNDFIALQDALSKVDNFDDLYASRLNALETSKIDKANIANNLITTTTGLVLDASQGKVLKDQVATINNNLAGLLYVKDYVVTGISFGSGATGSRALQITPDVAVSGYTPVATLILSIRDSNAYYPLIFFSQNMVCYINFYRTDAQATVVDHSFRFRVLYIKD